jgi:hypothetical protein
MLNESHSDDVRMSMIPGLQIENVVRSADPDFESQGLRP